MGTPDYCTESNIPNIINLTSIQLRESIKHLPLFNGQNKSLCNAECDFDSFGDLDETEPKTSNCQRTIYHMEAQLNKEDKDNFIRELEESFTQRYKNELNITNCQQISNAALIVSDLSNCKREKSQIVKNKKLRYVECKFRPNDSAHHSFMIKKEPGILTETERMKLRGVQPKDFQSRRSISPIQDSAYSICKRLNDSNKIVSLKQKEFMMSPHANQVRDGEFLIHYKPIKL